MSDNKNNLKNRFDNFEPEVDESHIEQNWQKIKEQLPKGKSDSKKGFIYLFLSIGLIIATGAGILIYFNTSNQNDSIDNFNANTTVTKQSTDQNTSNNRENMVIANGQKITLNNQNTSNNNDNTAKTSSDDLTQLSDDDLNTDIQTNENKFDQTNKTINTQSTASSNQSSKESDLSDINTDDKKSFAANNKTIISKKTNIFQKKTASKNANSKEIVNVKAEQPTANSSTAKGLNNEQSSKNESTNKQNETVYLQDTKVLPENMLSYAIFSLPKDSVYPDLTNTAIQYYEPTTTDKKTKKLSLEILVGPSFTTNKLNNNLSDSSYTEKYSMSGFSGYVAINYEIKPRLTINAQYFYNQISFNSSIDDTDNIEFYRNIKQTHTPSDSVSYLDTTKKYFEYNSTYSLKALRSHQFGIGLNYHIVDFKKLFLEAGIAFNIKQNSYNYEKIGKLNTDTMVYQSPSYTIQDTMSFTQTSSYPVSNYPDIDHSVKKDFKYSYGVMPNISIGYNINQRLGLLLKGSYYFDLGQNKINNEELLMKIKQNSLFLHFGVRIKL